MTLLDLQVTSLKLTDVQRRSLYLSLTLFGHTVWASWWPRPLFDRIKGVLVQRPKFTVGYRRPA